MRIYPALFILQHMPKWGNTLKRLWRNESGTSPQPYLSSLFEARPADRCAGADHL